jgi:hypothetical protein
VPNKFINRGVAVATTATELYSCPLSTEGIIHALYISNIDGTSSATVDIEVSVDGTGGTFYYVAKTVPVPADSTLILDKPLNLEASDKIRLTASATGDLQAFASILEIT